jgi:hypothetical protein
MVVVVAGELALTASYIGGGFEKFEMRKARRWGGPWSGLGLLELVLGREGLCAAPFAGGALGGGLGWFLCLGALVGRDADEGVGADGEGRGRASGGGCGRGGGSLGSEGVDVSIELAED